VFFLVNKIDGPEKENSLLPPFYELGVDKIWPISAAHGYGVTEFLDQLADVVTAPESPVLLEEGNIRVACIGRPNVGKSSMINRLLGEERMVVSNIPGTTRDSVDALLTRGDSKYLLIDTAGIRRKGKVQEKLEKFSVIRALGSLERCDIALVILDADEGITEQDTKVIGYALERGRACLLLLNKWDLLKGDGKRQQRLKDEVERAVSFAGYAPVLTVSALSGFGINRIFPSLEAVYKQYTGKFTTGVLNRILQDAIAGHSPSMHQGRRIKFYYVTQVDTGPPTFVFFVNYPKGVHFSYHRYLINCFRTGLKLDRVPLRILLRERTRRQLG
jgi:GTP-binding protein